MLRAEDLTQGYGRARIVEAFTLDADGGVLGLLGPNGAGKTTLLRTFATVVLPRSGTLLIGGEDLSSGASVRRARRRIGHLPQRFGFHASFTVAEYVAYCAWLRDVSRETCAASVERAIAAVDLTAHRRTRLGRLSGGMLRRCGIAAAIVGEPRLVLLDEPTTGLDPEQRLAFRGLVRRLAESGATVVLSTHLVEDVAAVCDRVCVLDAGVRLYDGTVAGLTARARPGVPGDTGVERGYVSVLRAAKEAVR